MAAFSSPHEHRKGGASMSNEETKGATVAAEHAADGSSTPEGVGAPAAASPKKPRRKGWIVAGVVAAVVIVAGAGFWVWHEQPSFCNAICHSPMDYYVETYEADDPKLGVTAHAKAGESCLDCHTAELTTQISEVCAWVSDNYPMTADGTMLATGKQFADEQFCARPECHHALGTSFDEITAGLWGFAGNDEKYNPHASHQDMALECGDCHKIHEQQVLVCNECHDLTLPEGWEAPNAE
ncbi:MAG: cytochrome c3 family protein [Adlercreutzia sp.]|nr:cytochrome c3 family protein [Adlercreutzia sp.]